jgi:hypothetical protein
VRNQVSHPYKTADIIIALFILIATCCDPEDQDLNPNNSVTNSLCCDWTQV